MEKKEKKREYERRMFKCENCPRPWSKTVPVDDPVSTCKRCDISYEAIDKENEIGIGTFCCPCGKTFTSVAQYGTDCKCYECDNLVRPDEIEPFRRMNTKSKHKHSCSECKFGQVKSCPNFNATVPPSKRHNAPNRDRKDSTVDSLSAKIGNLKVK